MSIVYNAQHLLPSAVSLSISSTDSFCCWMGLMHGQIPEESMLAAMDGTQFSLDNIRTNYRLPIGLSQKTYTFPPRVLTLCSTNSSLTILDFTLTDSRKTESTLVVTSSH